MANKTEITDFGNDPLDEKIFHQIKASLIDSRGVIYTDFKKKISPQYLKIWFDILLGWLFIAACTTTGFLVAAITGNIMLRIVIALLDAALLGLAVSYLVNFFHEAAHFNIAPKKNINDLLANMFLGILQAQGIKHYRMVHWQHHVHHGTVNDTEHSYFEALTFRFLVESLTGIRAVKIFLFRNTVVEESKMKKEVIAVKKEGTTMLLAGIAFHIILLCVFFYLEKYWLVGIWLVGFGTFFPFFSSMRQLLEHRNEAAEQKMNYSLTDHGKITRIFDSGIFASIIGSAGFTRHLLHHLEPQISYTNLQEVESFLLDTNIAPYLKKKRTTYFKTFIKLFGK